jgi:polysaccharide biosynthesis protein PslG
MRRRVLLAAVLAATSFVLLSPADAAASSGVRYGVQDDAWLLYGPEAPAERIRILQRLGVDVVRMTVRWDYVAKREPEAARNPDDPAYTWDLYDPIFQRLREAGIGMLVTLWGTPEWANGGEKPNRMPDSATALADFAYATATKYPWIRRWTVWNEPNLQLFLRPNSPRLYVSRLLNPTYRALKSADPRNLVAGGVTSPRKTPSGLSPVAWIRGMRAAHALLDAYAQNPYAVRPGETPSRGGCWRCAEFTMATLPKLIQEVRRSFGARTRIWLTEYGYNSKPPSRWLGVSNALQARYVGEAALRAYLSSRVDLLIHFLVRDEPNPRRWTSGVLTSRGKAKPSFSAFALPLAQVSRRGSRTTIWAQVRPRPGQQPYRLQQFRNGRWRWLGGTRWTSQSGFVRRVVTADRGSRLRLWSPRDRRYSAVLTIS